MESTAPKPFVFVLMPFDAAFDDVYQLGIKRACEDAGAYAERVDEQDYQGSITQRIYNQIAKADAIVADMTGRNANVFYEVGYAHALGKHVIMLTQDAEDIPFDLKDYPHIVYEGRITDLIPELTRRVRWAMEHLGQVLQVSPLRFYVDSVPLNDETVVTRHKPSHRRASWDESFGLEVHNSLEYSIETISFKLVLLTEERDLKVWVDTHPVFPSRLPNGPTMYALTRETCSLLPDEWLRLKVALGRLINSEEEWPLEIPLTLRCLSAEGVREHTFQVRIESDAE